MDQRTVAAYERGAHDYAERRAAYGPDDAQAFAASVPEGRLRLDVGCGPGHYTALLGVPVVALDAALAMVRAVSGQAPGALRVQADLEALPFRRGAFAGAWASKCYQHVPAEHLPLALADLHRSLEVGAPVELVLFCGDGDLVTGPDDDFPGRYFALWRPEHLLDMLAGAGFDVERHRLQPHRKHGGWTQLHVSARRAHTLPDVVGPGMRLLVCGLNPSLYAADTGVGFARPGNRFWPAAMTSGLVSRDRNPVHALRHHGVGMTDLVKRATHAAAELTTDDYRLGLARVERLCAWLRPAAVCVVGLAGWRAARDRRAVAGHQEGTIGGAPVYLMPSTSGLNAHVRLDEVAGHLGRAVALGRT